MADTKVVRLYRLSNWCHQRKLLFLSKLCTKLIRIVFSAEIPASCKLGNNVQLKHGGLGIVLHDDLVVGSGTIIYHNVTIGGREKSGTPTVGKNVYIGAGACILGNVVIEDGVKIGANSVVISNVSKGKTVIGIPAKEVKK